MIKLKDLLTEGKGKAKMTQSFLKKSKNRIDSEQMEKYLKILVKQGNIIPKTDFKELKGIISDYKQLDMNQSDYDIHDYDYHITELEDDWYSTLGDLYDKGHINNIQ